jgi:hemoglobin
MPQSADMPNAIATLVPDAADSVQTLSFAGAGLKAADIPALVTALDACPGVKHLDISENPALAADHDSAAALGRALAGRAFRSVNATSIGLACIDDGDVVLTALAKVVGLRMTGNVPRPSIPDAAVGVWTAARAQIAGGEDTSSDDAELASLLNGATIYEAIGGHDALAAVVNSFYVLMATDERVIRHFRSVTFGGMRRKQLAFLTQLLGGPAEYSGKAMGPAHAHLDITHAEYDATTTNLVSAILHHIPEPPVPIVRKLLQVTESMRADIVKE